MRSGRRRTTRPDNPRAEKERVLRGIGRVVGGAYLAFLLISLPEIGTTSEIVADWFTPVALIVSFVPGIALLPASVARDIRVLRITAAVAVAAYFVCSALWLAAWTGEVLDAERATWMVSYSGLPAVVAAMLWPAWASALTLLAGTLAASVITYLARMDATAGYLVLETTFAILYTSLFVLSVLLMRRAARLVDASRIDAYSATAAAAGAEARAVQRRRISAVVHDHVLSALLVASRQPPGAVPPAVAEQAATAIDHLDALAEFPLPFGGRSRVGADEVVSAIGASVAEVDEELASRIELDHRAVRPADTVIPADAALALVEATREAVRNSVRHAADGLPAAAGGVNRTVMVEVLACGVRVLVADDGVGFETGAVAPERMGVAVSICGRLADVGGTAVVHSAPGRGTLVIAQWPADVASLHPAGADTAAVPPAPEPSTAPAESRAARVRDTAGAERVFDTATSTGGCR